MIQLDLSYLGKKIDFASYSEKVAAINKSIDEKTGAGSDFLGWANYPETYDKEEFARIQKDAEYVRKNFNAVKAIPAAQSDIVQKIMVPTAKIQKVRDFAVTMTLSRDSMKTVLDTYTWNASEVIDADQLN